mgnify:CR=1 FL=1
MRPYLTSLKRKPFLKEDEDIVEEPWEQVVSPARMAPWAHKTNDNKTRRSARSKPKSTQSSSMQSTPIQSSTSPSTTLKNKTTKISLIIPAYNESLRITPMLQKTLDFTSRSTLYNFEYLVVNDGSSDDTVSVVSNFFVANKSANAEYRIVTVKKNAGKGAAIRTGMLRATGKYRLMVDADGATTIECLNDLLSEISPSPTPSTSSASPPNFSPRSSNDVPRSSIDVVFGSRAHLSDESKASRTIVRTILMYCFHFFVSIFEVHTAASRKCPEVRDTQCGFKLFTEGAALDIFKGVKLERWAFDLEVLARARLLGYGVKEVGVEWREIDGSKLDEGKLSLAWNSLTMLRDMVCVKICYMAGLWSV